VTDQGRRLVEAAGRVRQALEAAAGALTAADLAGLLRSEGDLELAIRRVPAPRSLPDEDRAALRAELEAIRRALRRCRRLGGALGDVVSVTLDVQGRTPGYGRPGTRPATYDRRRFDARG
jgi:hypothetical protein